jgi:hypothetical protein
MKLADLQTLKQRQEGFAPVLSSPGDDKKLSKLSSLSTRKPASRRRSSASPSPWDSECGADGVHQSPADKSLTVKQVIVQFKRQIKEDYSEDDGMQFHDDFCLREHFLVYLIGPFVINDNKLCRQIPCKDCHHGTSILHYIEGTGGNRGQHVRRKALLLFGFFFSVLFGRNFFRPLYGLPRNFSSVSPHVVPCRFEECVARETRTILTRYAQVSAPVYIRFYANLVRPLWQGIHGASLDYRNLQNRDTERSGMYVCAQQVHCS